MNRAQRPTYAEIALGWTFNCFSTLNGLSTFYYASRQRRPIHATWLRWYAYVRNVAAVLLLFAYNAMVNQYTVGAHTMHMYTIVLAMAEMNAVIIYACVTRCKRQRHLLHIANALARLPSPQYLIAPADGYHLDRLLCIKIANNLLQVLLNVIVNLVFFRSGSWCEVLLKFAVDLNVVGVIIGVQLPFFILLWYIVRHLSVLNARLAQCSTSADSIWLIYRDYSLLGTLTAHLYTSYMWLIGWLLFYYCTTIIALGYSAVYILCHSGTSDGLVFNSVTYVLYFVDLYVVDSLCEHVTTLSEDASLLLRQYSELSSLQLDACAEQCCNWFALHLSWRRLRIAICDRYAVNRSQTFYMVAQIILHTIFIVQSDYHNLTKSKISLMSDR